MAKKKKNRSQGSSSKPGNSSEDTKSAQSVEALSNPEKNVQESSWGASGWAVERVQAAMQSSDKKHWGSEASETESTMSGPSQPAPEKSSDEGFFDKWDTNDVGHNAWENCRPPTDDDRRLSDSSSIYLTASESTSPRSNKGVKKSNPASYWSDEDETAELSPPNRGMNRTSSNRDRTARPQPPANINSGTTWNGNNRSISSILRPNLPPVRPKSVAPAWRGQIPGPRVPEPSQVPPLRPWRSQAPPQSWQMGPSSSWQRGPPPAYRMPPPGIAGRGWQEPPPSVASPAGFQRPPVRPAWQGPPPGFNTGKLDPSGPRGGPGRNPRQDPRVQSQRVAEKPGLGKSVVEEFGKSGGWLSQGSGPRGRVGPASATTEYSGGDDSSAYMLNPKELESSDASEKDTKERTFQWVSDVDLDELESVKSFGEGVPMNRPQRGVSNERGCLGGSQGGIGGNVGSRNTLKISEPLSSESSEEEYLNDSDDYWEEEEDEKEEMKVGTKEEGQFFPHSKAVLNFLNEIRVKYQIFELKDEELEWKCPVCATEKGAKGAVKWWKGLGPLYDHSDKMKTMKFQAHQAFAKSMKKILEDRKVYGVIKGEKPKEEDTTGLWKGPERGPNDGKWLESWTAGGGSQGNILWPPLVMVVNTRLNQVGDKWVGMGKPELKTLFGDFQHIKQMIHSYAPDGHRGISMLVFQGSAEGFHEALNLDGRFRESFKGKVEWHKRRRGDLVGADGKRPLFGWMPTMDELDEFNRHLKDRLVVKAELMPYKVAVGDPLKFQREEARMSEERKRQINLLVETKGALEKQLKESNETLDNLVKQVTDDAELKERMHHNIESMRREILLLKDLLRKKDEALMERNIPGSPAGSSRRGKEGIISETSSTIIESASEWEYGENSGVKEARLAALGWGNSRQRGARSNFEEDETDRESEASFLTDKKGEMRAESSRSWNVQEGHTFGNDPEASIGTFPKENEEDEGNISDVSNKMRSLNLQLKKIGNEDKATHSYTAMATKKGVSKPKIQKFESDDDEEDIEDLEITG